MKKLSGSVQKRIAAAVIEARPALAVIADEPVELIGRIKRLLVEQDAVMVVHYYTHQDLQTLAEETGRLVADSLEMARFGHRHPARTLVVGLRFMGETAKILNPEKPVLMPTLNAECSPAIYVADVFQSSGCG